MMRGPMKIATYNVNGVNGRLDVLLRWLKEDKPDIVCLQELKTDDAGFPAKSIERAGYAAVWYGQKSWNGVAILSKESVPVLTRRGLPGDPDDSHSRYIEAAVNGVLIGCLYLPNGNPAPGPKFDYKLRWFRRLQAYAEELMEFGVPAMLIGDFNVMPTDMDVYKPERAMAGRRAIPSRSPRSLCRPDRPGLDGCDPASASGRAHLHLLEVLAEFLQARRRPSDRSSLSVAQRCTLAEIGEHPEDAAELAAYQRSCPCHDRGRHSDAGGRSMTEFDAALQTEMLAWFRSLDPVGADEMIGLWKGVGVPSGHPLDGVLENLQWFGKQFHEDMRVDALLFQWQPDHVVAIDPKFFPIRLIVRGGSLGRTAKARNLFSHMQKAFRARGPTASLQMLLLDNVLTAAMVYDSQPITDYFRRVDKNEIAGMMTVKDDERHLFFKLSRTDLPIHGVAQQQPS